MLEATGRISLSTPTEHLVRRDSEPERRRLDDHEPTGRSPRSKVVMSLVASVEAAEAASSVSSTTALPLPLLRVYSW